jgi:hypothetical protein
MNQKLSIRKNNGILVENEILNNINDGENWWANLTIRKEMLGFFMNF